MIQIGQTYTLSTAAISGRRIQYAPAGVQVRVISISAPAVVVEWKGERFPVLITDLKQ